MISSINLICSVTASSDEYFSTLRTVGGLIGVNDLSTAQRIFDGKSNVWIHLMDFDEIGYDELELKNIGKLLGAPAKTFVMVEFDDGETAVFNVLKIVGGIGFQWPIVFDNCFDRMYGPSEIEELVASGTY